MWYGRNRSNLKYRQLYLEKDETSSLAKDYRFQYDFLNGVTAAVERKKEDFVELATYSSTTSQGATVAGSFTVSHRGKDFECPPGQHWKTHEIGFARTIRAGRIFQRVNSLRYVRLLKDYRISPINNLWSDLRWGFDASEKRYVVETNPQIVQRCILMATDPGDLVLDPTCGSGTTATVAEQWGRRWITLDTSRVSLALARARLMGARYPYYHLADSAEGRQKEQEITGKIQPDTPTHSDVRQGFVYERAPHIMLKTIANNAEIDVIWDNYQGKLESIRESLNTALGEIWKEWEIPREAGSDWSAETKSLHAEWWQFRIARQKEIDKSIAQKADVEMLYDRPYPDTSKVRVAGPFTVECLSPHRVVPADEEELIDLIDAAEGKRKREHAPLSDFTQMVIDNLKSAGVHQAAKDDRITFTTIDGWPGSYIAAEGRYMEGETEKRRWHFHRPEFGTVTRADLTAAAREALDARFDALIACGFNFDAHTSELTKLGPLPILKAKMNPDLHMSG